MPVSTTISTGRADAVANLAAGTDPELVARSPNRQRSRYLSPPWVGRGCAAGFVVPQVSWPAIFQGVRTVWIGQGVRTVWIGRAYGGDRPAASGCDLAFSRSLHGVAIIPEFKESLVVLHCGRRCKTGGVTPGWGGAKILLSRKTRKLQTYAGKKLKNCGDCGDCGDTLIPSRAREEKLEVPSKFASPHPEEAESITAITAITARRANLGNVDPIAEHLQMCIPPCP